MGNVEAMGAFAAYLILLWRAKGSLEPWGAFVHPQNGITSSLDRGLIDVNSEYYLSELNGDVLQLSFYGCDNEPLLILAMGVQLNEDGELRVGIPVVRSWGQTSFDSATPRDVLSSFFKGIAGYRGASAVISPAMDPTYLV